MEEQNQEDHDKKHKEKVISMMRKIYPSATKQQLEEAFRNFNAFVDTAWRIAERIEREKKDTKSSSPDRPATEKTDVS